MLSSEWQELCEWAGFTQILNTGKVGYGIHILNDPTGNELDRYPPQDMNTLWKWMWPKLTMKQRIRVLQNIEHILIDHLQEHDLTEALAQAIYRVVKDADRNVVE